MDSRIAQRRAEVRRERMYRRRHRTITVAVVLVCLAVGAAIERSPLLALSDVRVVGTERLTPDEVVQAAALPLGTSTLRLRLAPARQRVEALPLVRRARVRRIDPLTVRIEVVERQPVLVLLGRDGPALVDADGVVVAAGMEEGLPVLATRDSSLPPLGAKVDTVPEAANAFAVYTALPAPLRTEVQRYDAHGPNDVELVLANGVRARFGRADRVADKARIMRVLIDDLQGTPIAAVDLRAPSNPVAVPAPPSPPPPGSPPDQ